MDRQRWLMLAAAAIVVALLAVVLVMALDDDEADDVVASSTVASSTSSPASTDAPTSAPSTTSPSTTEQPPPTTAPPTTPPPTTAPALGPDEAAFVVWPDPRGSRRFDDPVDAARSFAEDLVGFSGPVLGTFQQGDSRSGEVEVRAMASGPVTTVLLRQYGTDDSWWVIGASTPDIVVDEPAAQQAIDAPLQVRGRARAFEGQVAVAVHRDGVSEPLGTGFVTGSGDSELRAFQGSIPFTAQQGGWGSVVFSTASAQDGRTWQATVVRVGFIGGD